MWKASSSSGKGSKKQVRKPISQNFSPKRLAINFQPPTLILEYMVVDTGKLYHHKMRLDSILRKQNVSRIDVLNYIKTKHHLYFIQTKVKDEQILKFIDKILHKLGKSKSGLQKIEQRGKHLESSTSAEVTPSNKTEQEPQQQDDDFDYLNDDDQYEQDYEDYQQQQRAANSKQDTIQQQHKPQAASSFTTKALQKPSVSPRQVQNTFMTYCQEQYEDQEQQEEAQANWDLDIDQNADFDFV